MEIDKKAIYLLAAAALEGARKYHQEKNTNKPKDAKKSLPKEKDGA